MKFKTEIEHEFPLGAHIRAPDFGGLDGTILAVSTDSDGGTAYVISTWSRRVEAFVRHTISERELNGFTVVNEDKP